MQRVIEAFAEALDTWRSSGWGVGRSMDGLGLGEKNVARVVWGGKCVVFLLLVGIRLVGSVVSLRC